MRFAVETSKSDITTHLTKHWGVSNPLLSTILLIHSHQTHRQPIQAELDSDGITAGLNADMFVFDINVCRYVHFVEVWF